MNNIKKEIEKLKKEMIDDCWEYHKDILQEVSDSFETKKDIEKECLDFEVDTYTATGWELGYIYATNEILKIINK